MASSHNESTGKTWQKLLEEGQAPVWLPKAIGTAFAHAHGKGAVYGALPSSVWVDVARRTWRLAAVTGPGQSVAPPDDLTVCVAHLLSSALADDVRMRHVFQQVALLWRTYRDTRGLGTLSAEEAELVPSFVSCMTWPAGLGDALAATVDKQMAAGKVPTLHDLIDVLFYYVRDAQYRGRVK